MITADELREQAKVFDLNEADVQRDYVFGWLIAGVFGETDLGATAVLKGGNALRKGYFVGARFSDDLDLSTAHGLDEQVVLRELNSVCRLVEARTGVPFDIARNRLASDHQIDGDRRVYKFRLYFKDLLAGRGHIDISIRLDVTEFDRLWLPAQERQLIHPYSDADELSSTIRCVKLEEALADKLKCLIQRRYCYDIFDLVYGAFVGREIEIDRNEMMRVFLRKTIFGPSPLAAKQLLLDLPVDLFRGYWSKVLAPATSRFSFDEAIEHLKSGIELLFAPFPMGAQMAGAFYPARLRTPILEAAALRKLIRVRYHGIDRLMEPYALTFKRRKSDGVGHEYLYAYDITGGRSGPGIKTLFAHEIEQLEVTDVDFNPRYEIQLAKAGDHTQSGHFGGTGRLRPASRSPRPAAHRPGYVVQCSYCGKRFRRTTSSTKMNKHKDPNGFQCYGRAGYPLCVNLS